MELEISEEIFAFLVRSNGWSIMYNISFRENILQCASYSPKQMSYYCRLVDND
jgi:hypothetical protein